LLDYNSRHSSKEEESGQWIEAPTSSRKEFDKHGFLVLCRTYFTVDEGMERFGEVLVKEPPCRCFNVKGSAESEEEALSIRICADESELQVTITNKPSIPTLVLQPWWKYADMQLTHI